MVLTIKTYGEYEIVIQKSRFICSVSRAETEEEAAKFIQEIKKKHYNATHNCSCYIVGEHANHQKSNDDGEPSSTAGIPMLEVLRKNNMTDTVCVVTRYYGGIKLGASGLIRAYSGSVSEAIKQVGIVEKKKMQIIRLTFDYAQIGLIESRLKDYLLDQKTYLEKVTYDYQIPIEDIDAFISYIVELTNDHIEYELLDTVICEIVYIK